LKDHPDSGLAPDAIFQTGRDMFSKVILPNLSSGSNACWNNTPEHPIAEEALLQTASAYGRVGKHHESGARYKQYIEKYPEGERIDRAYLNYVDVLRDTREETAAIKWLGTIREKFKGKQPEALATFAEARIYLARINWPDALATLERLEKYRISAVPTPPVGQASPKSDSCVPSALEQLRRYPEAIDVYLSIPDGRNEYYGGQATER
jgi:tetratricopeptide (TPR) repeat protein